jgi:hypothetical protein
MAYFKAVKSLALSNLLKNEVPMFPSISQAKVLANWSLRKCFRHQRMSRSISRELIRFSLRMLLRIPFTRDKYQST